MKGVILCGGKGTRMLPATKVTNKHMLPVLNIPMVLYPLSTLKEIGVDDILIISGGNHIGSIAEFLGDGSEYGVKLTYKVQKGAGGIAQAIGLAEDFVHGEAFAVILGDNYFEPGSVIKGDSLFGKNDKRAQIFYSEVENPERFGVLTNFRGEYVIEEKPENPRSDMAVVGLYIYPNEVFNIIKSLKPSNRGELEVTDINNHFLLMNNYIIGKIDGFWSDMGTPQSMLATIKHLNSK